jgi:hypothetical protein
VRGKWQKSGQFPSFFIGIFDGSGPLARCSCGEQRMRCGVGVVDCYTLKNSTSNNLCLKHFFSTSNKFFNFLQNFRIYTEFNFNQIFSGFLLNFLLLYLIQKKTPKEMRSYSRIMRVHCISDMFFDLIQSFSGVQVGVRKMSTIAR